MKGDLISRKAVIKVLMAEHKGCIADLGESQLIAIGLESAIDIVRDIQGEDAAPVIHGQWIGEEVCVETDNISATLKECSVCHRIRPVDAYCSHCAAKMDEEPTDRPDAP